MTEEELQHQFKKMMGAVKPLLISLISELERYNPKDKEQESRIKKLELEINRLEREVLPDLPKL